MDTGDNVEARVRELLADELSLDVAQILPDSRLVEDLGADSIDAVEIVMRAEEEFEIEIDDDEAEQVTTVAEAIALVERLVNV